MSKQLLVLAVVALGLGACAHRHHYADADQPEYAYDGPPGAYAEDPYVEPPSDQGYAGDYDDYDGYDDGAYGDGYAPEPPRQRSDKGCDCDCRCCDRHAHSLAPRGYGPGPVRPVVPQDPAEWLE